MAPDRAGAVLAAAAADGDQAAFDELAERGAAIGPVRHMVSGQWVDGPHPERENYQSFADFADPDGNIWLLQEVDRTRG